MSSAPPSQSSGEHMCHLHLPPGPRPQWAPPCHPTCCRGHREVCTWEHRLWVREEGETCVLAGGRSLRSLWRERSSKVTGSRLHSGKISLESTGSVNTGDLLGGIGVAPARGQGVRDGGARALGWGMSSGVFPGSWLSQVRCLSQEEVASGVGPWDSSVHWGDGELGTTEHPCHTGGGGVSSAGACPRGARCQPGWGREGRRPQDRTACGCQVGAVLESRRSVAF